MPIFDPFAKQDNIPNVVVEGGATPTQQPAQEMSTFDKYLGIGSPAQRFVAGAINEPLMALGQVVIDPFANVLGYGKPVTEYAQRIAQQEEQGRAARGDTGLDIYKTAGAVVSPATYIPATRAAQVAGTGIRGGLLSGATTGMLAAPTLNEDIYAGKTEQAGTGALIGGLFGKGTELVGRVVSPRITSEEKIIREMGIQPTTGESLGGVFRKLEEFASRVPGVDMLIKPARQASVESFNTGMYNRVLSNLKDIVGKEEGTIAKGTLGTDAVKAMDETISNAYNKILPNMEYRLNTNTYGNINNIVAGLNDDQQKVVSKFLTDRFGDKLKKGNGALSGDDIKMFESDLRKKIDTYSGTGKSGSDIEIGDALKNIRNIFRDDLYSQNPQFVPSLRKVDRAYAEAEVLREAVNRVAPEKNGIFTPHDLGMAVKSTAGTAGEKTLSRGQALLQEESKAATKVLGGADRGTSAVGALGAGYAAAGNLPAAIVTAGGLGVLYSKYGQKFVDTLMTKRPEMAQRIGNAIQSAGTITPAIAAQIDRISKEEQLTPEPQVFDPFSGGNRPTVSQPQSKAEAVNVIAQAATNYGKPELANILTGIAKVESNFDPKAKSKSSTAAGMFQFTKATQKEFGLNNPYDASQSAGAAAAYIDRLMQRYKGDKIKALAAYNQGPGVIDKGLNKAGREYAMKVLAASRNI